MLTTQELVQRLKEFIAKAKADAAQAKAEYLAAREKTKHLKRGTPEMAEATDAEWLAYSAYNHCTSKAVAAEDLEEFLDGILSTEEARQAS